MVRRAGSLTAPFVALGVCTLIAVLALSGCEKKGRITDEGGLGRLSGASSPTYFSGFFASEGGVGRMGVIISTSANALAPAWNAPVVTVSAVGALSLENGGVVNLAGSYDTASDSVHLTGAGYDFEGRAAWVNGTPRLTGSYVGPGDDGAFAVARLPVHQYCGRLYMAGDSTVGRLAYVVTGTAILGAACFSNEPEPVLLQGELDTTSPKPRLSLSGTSAARDLTMRGGYDEEADESAGSWTSTGPAGDAIGTWSVGPCP